MWGFFAAEAAGKRGGRAKGSSTKTNRDIGGGFGLGLGRKRPGGYKLEGLLGSGFGLRPQHSGGGSPSACALGLFWGYRERGVNFFCGGVYFWRGVGIW